VNSLLAEPKRELRPSRPFIVRRKTRVQCFWESHHTTNRILSHTITGQAKQNLLWTLAQMGQWEITLWRFSTSEKIAVFIRTRLQNRAIDWQRTTNHRTASTLLAFLNKYFSTTFLTNLPYWRVLKEQIPGFYYRHFRDTSFYFVSTWKAEDHRLCPQVSIIPGFIFDQKIVNGFPSSRKG